MSRISTGLFSALAVTILLSGVSLAQVYTGYGRPWGYGDGWGGGTVYGNYAMGMSSVIRAQADANVLNTQAALQNEQVKRAQLENKRIAQQTYYEMRRVNEEQRAAEEARRRARAASIPTKAQPPLSSKRLPATQLDPVTGHIQWPAILMSGDYAGYRAELEQLFKTRAEQGRPVSMTEVQHALSPMRMKLDAGLQQNVVAPQDWLSAKRILDGLELETQFPAG